ncbi:FAD-dependent oxidoreductase [Microbacterium paraoxydans]
MKPLWKVDQDAPHGTPFDPGAQHDVLIVGAGLTGLSTAVLLTRAGLDVVVVDAGTWRSCRRAATRASSRSSRGSSSRPSAGTIRRPSSRRTSTPTGPAWSGSPASPTARA